MLSLKIILVLHKTTIFAMSTILDDTANLGKLRVSKMQSGI